MESMYQQPAKGYHSLMNKLMSISIPRVLLGAALVASIFGISILIKPSDTDAASLQSSEPPHNLSRLPVGVNLASPTYYSSEIPFADVFMLSSNWFHQNSNSTDPWELGGLEETDDGWPILEAGHGAACLMMRNIHGRYPKGIYTCTYTGTGDITIGFDGHIISSKPNQITFEVLNPSDSGIFFKIKSQDSNDPVRNVKIWLPSHSQNTAGKSSVFNPMFLDRISPFSVIRFMDWQGTNNSTLISWADRTLPTDRTQATSNGVAVEYLIELCNTLSVDPWICIPHQADDDFIQQFAALMRDSLDPNLRIYLEYSNEVWNAQFDQYAWVNEHGNVENQPANYASFAANVFNIWHEEFATEEHRVIRVAGCQHMNPWVAEVILNQLDGNVDAIAPAFYFGVQEQFGVLEELGSEATAEDVMQIALQMLHESAIPKMNDHAALATLNNIDLITYEGGQHILPQPAGTTPPFMQAMWEAQRHPLMYVAYSDMLESLDMSNGKLFVAYNFVGLQDSQWGSWGHLDHLSQSLDTAPKYRAIMDFAVKMVEAPN